MLTESTLKIIGKRAQSAIFIMLTESIHKIFGLKLYAYSVRSLGNVVQSNPLIGTLDNGLIRLMVQVLASPFL